jgi:hypothetical protein
MEFVRIEGFGQVPEEAVSVFGRCANQRVADDHAKLTVYAPVDEKAETLIAEPLQSLLLIQGAYFRIIRGSGAGQNREIHGHKDKGHQTKGTDKKSRSGHGRLIHSNAD